MFKSISVIKPPCCFKNIEVCCNSKKAYQFDLASSEPSSNVKRIGHLITLAFPSANKELMPDLVLANPETPQVKNKAAGVIERIAWAGGSDDQVEISCRLSFQNKRIFQEVLSTWKGDEDLRAEWIIYDYDVDQKKYFKRFYTCEEPVMLGIAENTRIWITEDADDFVQDPVNFILEASLTPRRTSKKQLLGFAFGADGLQFTQHVGG